MKTMQVQEQNKVIETEEIEKITITTTVSKALLGAIAMKLYGENKVVRKNTEILRDIIINYAADNLSDEIIKDFKTNREEYELYFDSLKNRNLF